MAIAVLGTGTNGGFGYRVIYPVTMTGAIGFTLLVLVGEPGLKLGFNRY